MILCDTHADTLYGRAKRPDGAFDVTLDRLKAGGVSVQTLALYVGGKPDIPVIAEMFEKMWQAKEALMAEGWQQVMDPRDAVDGETRFMLSVEGCDLLATIPMADTSSASSFNVACAATVMMYEVCRQRAQD